MPGSEIIDHGGGGQSHVIHIGAGIRDALGESLEHLGRGNAHVSTHQHFVGF